MTRSDARRAVLFDLDNTLILEDEATLAAVRAAAQVARERAGVDDERLANAAVELAERLWKAAPAYADGEVFGIWWGEALWGEFAGEGAVLRAMRDFVPGFREAVWRGALASAGSTDVALAGELERAYIRTRRSRELIDPEAEPMLADLSRDHRLALVTNGSGDVQREKLSRTALARYFDEIVISVEVGVAKPDPRIFEIALERLGVDKRDALMVGDSLERDVEGAHRADLHAIWIDRGDSHVEGPRADAMVRRLSDLRVVLDALEQRTASRRATP